MDFSNTAFSESMVHQHLLVGLERRYWDEHSDKIYTLEPFFVRPFTGSMDELIEKRENCDHEALFIIINYGNGVDRYIHCSWNENGNLLHYIDGDRIRDKCIQGNEKIGYNSIVWLLNSLYSVEEFFDLGNPYVFGHSSLYLTIKKQETTKRYAARNDIVPRKNGTKVLKEALRALIKKYLNHSIRDH
ncbi:MAG: hypothetical protein FWG75_05055 [Cystobacterineae bacterium]|nr:hypothetical protein [Cystobacterineae bacterium]